MEQPTSHPAPRPDPGFRDAPSEPETPHGENASPQRSGAQPDFSALVNALVSNPQLLQSAAALLGTVTAGQNASPHGDREDPSAEKAFRIHSDVIPADPAPSSGEAPSPASALPDGIAEFLSDPAFAEKLPQMLSLFKSLFHSSAPVPAPGESDEPSSCRDHLLLALKPFLSPERAAAVDTILRLNRLGGILRQLK